MKVLYSQLKKYLPNLTASANEVTDAYTLTGFMLDKSIVVKYLGKEDKFFDLEVRQNRADAFGVKGLARELSAYFNIPLAFLNYEMPYVNSEYNLPIEVKATSAVKRVYAIKIEDISIGSSPDWLKEYLNLYDINSINNLVDLTNYVMLETGHASHAFDLDSMSSDKLIWEINPGFKEIVTLAGTTAELSEDAIVISDGDKPLSLSFIGGKEAEINSDTKNIILEISIYDGGLVRRNSRQMKIITEAGQRLEKYLDPESIPEAFAMLVNLILENCGGRITSKIYDNYIQPTSFEPIRVNLDKVQQIAGTDISYEDSIKYLTRLGFTILEQDSNILLVKRPIDRLDIELEEDVYEEIIRMKGYNNIPKDSLSSLLVSDITPERIKLVNQLEDILTSRGYDEVRSWILVDSTLNQQANYLDGGEIQVTNSINEEVPFLRQSIAVSLIDKFQKYLKNNIPDIQIFEEGKVFSDIADQGNIYIEALHAGMLVKGNNINKLKLDLEFLLRKLGATNIIYKEAKLVPQTAHPKTCWDIFLDVENYKDLAIGIIYLSNTNITKEFCLAEIDLGKVEMAHSFKKDVTIEVTQKLVELDENIELPVSENINEFLINKLNKNSNVWKWEVTDTFNLSENQVRYTVRIYYVNLTDPEAKALHSKIFS